MQAPFFSARNQFNKPPVGLIFKQRNSDQCNDSYQEIRFNTTLELDLHHQHLLRSDDDHEVLLGICSVIYWSQYKSTTSGEYFSTTSAFSADMLTPKIANTKPKSAAKIVRKSITELDHKNYAQALILRMSEFLTTG